MSSVQQIGKSALRVAKNYTKGYSDTQAKVRDATSNDPWGPSGTQMNEIAQMTYNQNDFVEIMEMLDKRLNDKGKNWRHVFKSLTVLDYCLHAGSENVVIYFKDNVYVIKTLKEFQFVDEDGKDQGANVRQKAKDITNLLSDDARLRQERRSRANMRDRMTGRNGGDDEEDLGGSSSRRKPERSSSRRQNKDEDDLRRAIEESKRSLAAEKEQTNAQSKEEMDLAEAIRLSEEEEANRKRGADDATANALFDDHNQLPAPQMQTLSDPTAYAYGLQPQMTFNPYQQQAQQEAMQAEYLRQQQEWMRQQQEAAQLQAQQEEWQRQQMMQQYQQQQQQAFLQQQQQQAFLQQQQQSLVPQPTGFGSNNPFAPQVSSPPPPMPAFSLDNDTNRRPEPAFNLQGTFDGASSQPVYNTQSPAPVSPSTTPAPKRQATRSDREHSELANLWANRDDGQDTFGNIGALRYGQTGAGKIALQKTGGYNPFNRQQQQQGQATNPDQPFFTI